MPPRARSRRRPIAIGLALLGLAGLGLGSAAQLHLEADTLGAGLETVASCQGETPIQIEFETDFANGAYVVPSISLAAIHTNCLGKNLELTVMDDNDVLHSEGPVTVDDERITVAMDPAPSAEAITQIAVVIAD